MVITKCGHAMPRAARTEYTQRDIHTQTFSGV